MKSKKILLGSLSTMALVATPIAAVVSCDNGKTAEADAKKTEKKEDAKTDGKTGGKVNPVIQGPFIRKTTVADKGLVVAIGQPGGPQKRFFITEEEAKTETAIKINGNTLVLPAMTKTSTNLKGKVNLSPAALKQAQDDARKQAEDAEKAKTNPTPDAAAITAAGDAAVAGVKPFDEMPISAITSVVADEFVLNQRFVAPNVAELKEMIKGLLMVVNGKGIYNFEFTPASLNTNTPVLTTASDTAFKKIFTDLSLTLSNLVFEKNTASMGTIITITSLDLA